MTKPPGRRRAARTAAYAAMAVAGVAAMIWPTAPAVRSATAGAGLLIYVWALMFVVGGVSSALGSWSDRWLGELVGLGPLISVFVVYGLSAFVSSRGYTAWAGGFLFLAVAAFLFSRWQDVSQIREEATRLADRS